MFDCQSLTEVAFIGPLLKMAKVYKFDKITEPSRANPFSCEFICWLEFMVCDKGVNPVDRMVCGRLRAGDSASVRHDDMKSTPADRCEWLRNATAS